VIFTELGYSSFDGVNRSPWEWGTPSSNTEDQQEQADCLEATFTVMTKRDWFKGMYYWNWFSHDIANPLGYPIRGKIAQSVLAAWYQNGHSAPSSEPHAVKAIPTKPAPTPPPGQPAPAATPAPGRSAVIPPTGAPAKVLFSFEQDAQGWGIPDWALEKTDMVAKEVTVGKAGATEGKQALQVAVDFAGGKWAGALVEVEEYFDWTPHNSLAVDVTLPPDAPAGLKAKIILTVGEDWEWTEMRRSIQLTPGQTTTLRASLAPGSEDWKRALVDENFRKDVRKVAIRVESNKPAFKGSLAIDNVQLE